MGVRCRGVVGGDGAGSGVKGGGAGTGVGVPWRAVGACPARGRGLRWRGCAAADGRAGGQRARGGAESGFLVARRTMAASPGSAGLGSAGAVHGSSPSGFAFDSGLEIKTRSVEQTLLPLVSQVKCPPCGSCAPSSCGPPWRRPLLGPGLGPGAAGVSGCLDSRVGAEAPEVEAHGDWATLRDAARG